MARPEIEGRVIRHIDLNCTRGNSNKDYRITISYVEFSGYSVDSEYGPAGSLRNGQILGAGLGFPAAEKIAYDLRFSKEKKGYGLVSDRSYPSNRVPDGGLAAEKQSEEKVPHRLLKSIVDVSAVNSEIKTLLF